jgi:hypothetical protein
VPDAGIIVVAGTVVQGFLPVVFLVVPAERTRMTTHPGLPAAGLPWMHWKDKHLG